MRATQRLHDLGQSLWLDHITRGLLTGGTLRRYIDELASEDLTQAADLFRSIHDATGGRDGWVSLEVSPLIADDAASTLKRYAARAEPSWECLRLLGTMKVVAEHHGFTPDHVLAAAREQVARRRRPARV